MEYWTFHGLFVIEIINIREPVVKVGSAYWVFGYSRTLWSEKAMAPNSSTLAWKIPSTEEPGRLQSMGSLRVGQENFLDWATSFSLFTFMHLRRKWQPLQCSCLENPRDGGAWWAAVYGVTQGQTQLKQVSSSSTITTPSRDNQNISRYCHMSPRDRSAPNWELDYMKEALTG